MNTLLVLLSLLVTTSATAQWTQLYSFNSQIFTVHFLSSIGRPDIGFVGTANGSVWRTTDRGLSWTRSTTPASLTLPVSSFSFKDQNTGWMSARQTSLTTGVFKTTDGGITWVATSQRGEQACVSYNPTSRVLVSTSWSGNNVYSTNDGLTWRSIGISTNQNNITYLTPMNGLMTSNSGYFAVTTNGGASWSNVPFKDAAWQPLAIQGKGRYFIAAERRKQILRSDDGGVIWNIIHQFPPGTNIIGDIKGDSTILYVQTREEFLYSLDSGVSWNSFCGPGNAYNTNFFVSGDTLYGGTVDGYLWWNAHGVKQLASVLDFSTKDISLSSSGCFDVDTLIKLINVSDCLPLEINDIGIIGSPQFSISHPTLPDTLLSNDSIKIKYIPNDYKTDSAQVIVGYTINGSKYETRVNLHGNGAPGENILLTKELDLLLASDCNTIDTAVTLKNGPCDTLQIRSLVVSAPTLFSISNSASFPQTLSPGGSAQIRMNVNGNTPGDYIATLVIRLSTGGIERDTSVTLRLKVLSTKEPQAQLSQSRMAFDSVIICDVRYDTLWFKNTICKPLKLTSVALLSGNPNYNILYQPALPRLLSTDDSDHVIIQYTPTSPIADKEQLKLSFEFDAATKLDTTIKIEGIGKPVCNTSLTEGTLSFEPLLVCEQAELTTHLRNFSCDSVTILSISGLTDQSFQILSPAIPSSFAPNDSVLIRVAEVPLNDGGKFDSIKIHVRTKNGAEQIITLKLVGTVKPKVRSLSLPSSIIVDSIPPCTTFDTSFTIYNFGICDTLAIDSTIFNGPSWYSFIGGPLTPAYIPPGDSATFIFRFSPGSGVTASGGIRLTGTGLDTTIKITVSSKKGGAPFILSVDDSIFYAFLCKTASRTFAISNYGCDTLLIDSLSLASNPQFSFNSTMRLPLKIAPNEDTSFVVDFDPSKQGDSTSLLVIKSGASGISRSVPLLGSLIGSKGTVRFDVASVDNSTVITKPAGDIFTTKMVIKDNIEALRGLTSVVIDIKFYDNVLTVANVVVNSPWIFKNKENFNGLLRLTLSRPTSSPINAETELGKISFRVTIGDSSYSPIRIDKVILNGTDSIYHSCVLEPLSLSGAILQVDDTCGDAFIRGYINHDGSIFDNMRIVPNPTNDEKGIVANFDLNLSGDVKMAIFDINGKMVLSADATFPKGRHTMSLPSSSLPEGQYLVGLESSGTRSMSRVLIVK